MTPNSDLAAHLRKRAEVHPGGSHWRRALLVAAVALETSRTHSGAHKTLAAASLPDDVRTGAVEVLEDLTKETGR